MCLLSSCGWSVKHWMVLGPKLLICFDSLQTYSVWHSRFRQAFFKIYFPKNSLQHFYIMLFKKKKILFIYFKIRFKPSHYNNSRLWYLSKHKWSFYSEGIGHYTRLVDPVRSINQLNGPKFKPSSIQSILQDLNSKWSVNILICLDLMSTYCTYMW